MKKSHIILLVLIAVAIVVLISYTGDLSSYETIASAKQKQGKFLNLIVKAKFYKLFVFHNSKNKIRKGSKTTYADWCVKHGFQFADKTIPSAWLESK